MKKRTKLLRLAVLLGCAFHLTSIFLTNIIALNAFEAAKNGLPPRSVKLLDAAEKVSQNIPQSIQSTIGLYTTYTGITGYSFFSPDPPFPYQIIVERTDANGGQAINTMAFNTQEGYNRLTAASNFIRDIKNDTLKDLMMRSVAARTFEKFAETNTLRIVTAYYILPPPKAFRDGNKQFFEQHALYEFEKYRP